MKPQRFTKESWLQLGLSELAKKGPEALTIHKICQAAGRTTGSFYHHFGDHAGFISALMKWWNDRYTNDAIKQLEASDNKEKNSTQLGEYVSKLDQRVETGVRHLAQKNPIAAEIVAEVDKMRIGYLTELRERNHKVNHEDAVIMSELEYAAFVGQHVIWKDSPPDHFRKLGQLFEQMAIAHLHQNTNHLPKTDTHRST